MDWPALFRETRAQLGAMPSDLQGFRWTAYSFQAKAWYGNPAIHYEIWPRKYLKVAELGLHFEADELTNARLLAAFRARKNEIKRRLGTGARIEEWDKGWTRVWEPFSFGDADLAQRLPLRFCDYVRTLEPILREELPSDVRWVLPATARRTAKATKSPRFTSSRTSRSGR